jgi:hypothetical protein
MVTLMMLDEVFLAVEDTVATIDDTRPVLSSLMHPHLVFLPIRFGLERLLALLFGTIGTKHERFARLALRLVIVRDQ